MVSKLIKMPKYGILFKIRNHRYAKGLAVFKARLGEPLAYSARGFAL